MANAKLAVGPEDFRDMFLAATAWLEKSAADIDALNVFPVPDGDTGTNMLLTMRSAIEATLGPTDHSVSAVAKAMARGALMGARGNSGVILSQIWHGIAEGLGDVGTLTGPALASALTRAAEVARNGLSNPVEGTILTVIKDAAKAAEEQAKTDNDDVMSVFQAAVDAAQESVANTPKLLAILRDAGVVDAGGQGLFVLLDGALRYLSGEGETMKIRKPHLVASSMPLTPRVITSPQSLAADEKPFGYCTEFLLCGSDLDPNHIRAKLKRKGESLIVVGDENIVRIHIHTLKPGNVLNFGTSLGIIQKVNIRNMDEQFLDFLKMQKERSPAVDMAVVAVVTGQGLAEVFTSLGANYIVPGGQTMNPSTKDILQAVEAVNSNKVIILPNNKNIILAAEQVAKLTSKQIRVVPSRTIPEGVAALLAFDYEGDLDSNAQSMTEALSKVRTIEVTRAVRAAQLDGLAIKKKQAIGLLDGHLIAAADSPSDVLKRLFGTIDLSKSEVVTLYYGADTSEAEAQQMLSSLAEDHPDMQFELVCGGQPHYNYIVSIE